MLRNGVTPIPPASQSWRPLGTFQCEKDPIRALDDRVRARLEPAKRAGVVADRLDGHPQARLARGGGDGEGMELVAEVAGAEGEHLALHRELERVQLLPERERAEGDEDELPRRESEWPALWLHRDLGDVLVQPVHGRDPILAPPNEHVAEHGAIRERGDAEGRQRRHVAVQRGGLELRSVRCEHVVGGGEEDEPERALDVDEDLVPEPHEQRQQNRHGHRAEREHPGEHGPARARPEEVERRAAGDASLGRRG